VRESPDRGGVGEGGLTRVGKRGIGAYRTANDGHICHGQMKSLGGREDGGDRKCAVGVERNTLLNKSIYKAKAGICKRKKANKKKTGKKTFAGVLAKSCPRSGVELKGGGWGG